MVHIILTGATGLVGSAVLSNLLASPAITHISILSRRPVTAAEGHAKANVILHSDYASYPASVLEQLRGAKGCVWAQGKSSVGMTEPDYTKLTYDWPLAAAKSFASMPGSDETGFNFVYVSGEGADPSGQSQQLFGRVKGKAERDLLGTADAREGLSVYNLRPAGVDGSGSIARPDRSKSRLEMAYGLLYPVLKRVAPKWHTPVDSLAKVAVDLAQGEGKPLTIGDGVEAGGWTLRNTAIRRLAGLDPSTGLTDKETAHVQEL